MLHQRSRGWINTVKCTSHEWHQVNRKLPFCLPPLTAETQITKQKWDPCGVGGATGGATGVVERRLVVNNKVYFWSAGGVPWPSQDGCRTCPPQEINTVHSWTHWPHSCTLLYFINCPYRATIQRQKNWNYLEMKCLFLLPFWLYLW